MFDPSIGEWLEEDPIGFAGGDANTRRYVGNDGPNAVDPSGLEEKEVTEKFKVTLDKTVVNYTFSVAYVPKGKVGKVGIKGSITIAGNDTIGDLAKLWDGDMIFWYQLAVSDSKGVPINNYKIKNPENAYINIIISKGPYIDPPAGGYSSNALPIADGLPWYDDVPGAPLVKLPFDALEKLPRKPDTPTGIIDPTKNVASMADAPGRSNLGNKDEQKVEFKTWAVVIDKKGNPLHFLQGFSWTFNSDNKGDATISDVKITKVPPTKAEFEDLLEANGFPKMQINR